MVPHRHSCTLAEIDRYKHMHGAFIQSIMHASKSTYESGEIDSYRCYILTCLLDYMQILHILHRRTHTGCTECTGGAHILSNTHEAYMIDLMP